MNFLRSVFGLSVATMAALLSDPSSGVLPAFFCGVLIAVGARGWGTSRDGDRKEGR